VTEAAFDVPRWSADMTCRYCGRAYGDPRGCRYPGCATAPVPVRSWHCPVCITLPGKLHHAMCSEARCRKCGGYYARCFAIDCETTDAVA
jgi:hypothetical protein